MSGFFVAGAAGGGVGGASAAVTSDKISVLSNAISVVSNALSALEVRVSTLEDTPPGSASVTSDELSIAAAALSTRIDTQSDKISILSNKISTISQNQSAMSQKISAISHALSDLSNTNSVEHAALSTAINVVSDAVSALEVRVSALSAAPAGVSVTSDELSVRVQTASAAATSVNARVNSVNTFISGISARSVGDVSTHGLQSVIDALSNRISGVTGGTASVTSQELSVALVVLSDKISVASAAATSADGHANTASAAATSVDTRVNALSQVVSLLSNTNSAEHAALSGRINSVGGGATGSTNLIGMNADVQVITTAVAANISGCAVSVSANAVYNIVGMFAINKNSAGVGPRFGLTFPSMSVVRGFFQHGNSAAPASATGFSGIGGAYFNGNSASNSLYLGISIATNSVVIKVDGLFNVGGAGGVVQAIAATSSGATLSVLPGNFLRAFKLR